MKQIKSREMLKNESHWLLKTNSHLFALKMRNGIIVSKPSGFTSMLSGGKVWEGRGSRWVGEWVGARVCWAGRGQKTVATLHYCYCQQTSEKCSLFWCMRGKVLMARDQLVNRLSGCNFLLASGESRQEKLTRGDLLCRWQIAARALGCFPWCVGALYIYIVCN